MMKPCSIIYSISVFVDSIANLLKAMANLIRFLFFTIFVCTINPSLWAQNFLEAHSRNPGAASQWHPLKSGSTHPLRFSREDISQRRFVVAKAQERNRILCQGRDSEAPCLPGFEPQEAFNHDWQLRHFINGPIDKNIFSNANFDQGQAQKIPWAGYYWPTAKGGIGNRYADPHFPQSDHFKKNYDHYQKNSMKVSGNSMDQLSQLSPAEKYDYLMNDPQWSLTLAVWNEGKFFLDRTGSVETWMGICHGWAPAAIAVQEPVKYVDLNLPQDKGTLRFYPHDIKALASQLWAMVPFNVEFVGGRCDLKNPHRDENGRLTDPECFDMNPSAWHLALTHQLGKNQQSFVLDATYDYEVWNQPIYSYKLNYFNPATQQSGPVATSIIPYASLNNDPYRKYRPANVAYIVGVISEIQYVDESEPSPQDNSTGNPFEHLVTVTYYYDLELDANYTIVGGEWYQQEHPDMLWRTADGSQIQHPKEARLLDWNGQFPIPMELLNIGPSVANEKTPLSKILNLLVSWSN